MHELCYMLAWGTQLSVTRPATFMHGDARTGRVGTPHERRLAMVRTLREQGVVRDARVAAALEEVPRERFVPADALAEAHADAPLPIGAGQTISAPHMVAMMAEALDLRPGHRVLEVGGGSGYHAAIMAKLVVPGGRVVSVERVAELADAARKALAGLDPLPVDVVVADGSLGHPERAPYDRISVAAGAPAFPPPLLEQLAPGGIMVIPVGPSGDQWLYRVRKRADGSIAHETLGAVRFVPLVGAHGWPV